MIDESKKQNYREIIIDLYNQPDKSSYDTLKLTKISFECVEKYKAIRNREIEILKEKLEEEIDKIDKTIDKSEGIGEKDKEELIKHKKELRESFEESIKKPKNEVNAIDEQLGKLNGLREKINSLIIEIDLKLNSKGYLEMQLGNLLRDNTSQINEFNAFVFESFVNKSSLPQSGGRKVYGTPKTADKPKN